MTFKPLDLDYFQIPAQVHSWVEIRLSFRLIPHWTRLRLAFLGVFSWSVLVHGSTQSPEISMKWTFIVAIFLTCAVTAGCTICVNGQGIGCGYDGYVSREQLQAEQDATETKLDKQMNHSFVTNLARAAGIREDGQGADIFSLETLKERADVALVLEQMADDLYGFSSKHNESEPFRQYFGFPMTLPRLKVSVVERGVTPTVNCESKTIEFPARLVRELLRGGMKSTVDGSVSTPFIPRGPFHPGTIVRRISESSTEQFADWLALLNTAAYRTMAFLLAHESAHAWAQQCVTSPDADIQNKREASADFFATIVASELYSSKCMEAPFYLKTETFAALISGEKTKYEDFGQLIADNLSEMDLNRFLVAGGGDVEFFFKALADSVSTDDTSHPIPGIRVSLDLYVRKQMIRQFYNDLNEEVKSSLIIRLLVPEEQRNLLYERMKYKGVVYKEYLSNDLLKCSVVSFQ